MTIPFDMNNLDADKEYFLIIEFLQPADRPWAEKGFVQMREQLPVKSATPYAPIVSGAGKSVKINESAEGITVSGDGFKIVFDDGTGSIYTLNYNGKDYITPVTAQGLTHIVRRSTTMSGSTANGMPPDSTT